nr:SIS domain-containing protein [uncultured Nitrososphaera sp.]
MNSIEAMAQDIGRQLDDLPRLVLPAPAGNVAFVGSGDSYAAALAACYLSSGRATCWRPADVISDPSLLVGRSACFVSISGRTRSNIQAASAARKAGVPTVAITADGKSPLASACDSVFALDFKSAGKTSGTISFAASMLACTHLATQGKTGCPADLNEIYARASKAAGRLAGRVRTGSIIMLGDSLLFSVAMYGALKFNEVFGSRAQAYPLEEFFHAPLFGLKCNDQVIVLGTKGDYVALARRVNGLPVDCSASVPVELLFYAVFFIQHLVLAVAKKKRLQECYFMRNKRLLKTSSKVIY